MLIYIILVNLEAWSFCTHLSHLLGIMRKGGGHSLVLVGLVVAIPSTLIDSHLTSQGRRIDDEFMTNSQSTFWTPFPPHVGHHRGLLWIMNLFFVGVAVAIRSTLRNSRLTHQGRRIDD